MTKIAIVTGGNKGIGYAVVKGLCEKYNGDVFLTSRDVQRGQEAILKLNKLGFHPKYHQLDILDGKSIANFAQFIKQNYGGIDVLVNNAAIMFGNGCGVPFAVQAEETIKTNYFALLNVCKELFPLLNDNAQVVNFSSSLGHLSRISSESLRNKLKDPNLTTDALTQLMQQFVSSAQAGRNSKDGWGNSAYAVSKVGVCALTIIQQRQFDMEGENVFVNSVHPGFVDTDMSQHLGHLTIEQGARAPLYLALGNHNLKGKFIWSDSSVKDWASR